MVLMSIPFAVLGGYITLSPVIFSRLLGVLLLVAAVPFLLRGVVDYIERIGQHAGAEAAIELARICPATTASARRAPRERQITSQDFREHLRAGLAFKQNRAAVILALGSVRESDHILGKRGGAAGHLGIATTLGT